MIFIEDVETEEKILRLIGLAKRAGQLACGHDAVEQALRRRKTSLLIVAKDASERSLRDIEKKAERFKSEAIAVADRSRLGQYTGADLRAVVAVLDLGFEEGIRKMVNHNVS